MKRFYTKILNRIMKNKNEINILILFLKIQECKVKITIQKLIFRIWITVPAACKSKKVKVLQLRIMLPVHWMKAQIEFLILNCLNMWNNLNS
jgi:hypothetical protein